MHRYIKRNNGPKLLFEHVPRIHKISKGNNILAHKWSKGNNYTGHVLTVNEYIKINNYLGTCKQHMKDVQAIIEPAGN
jgi:hypothetical protein